MASKLGTKQAAAAADQEFDPKYEWQENDANYVLRLHLSGFRKEDFRVQVDGAGRLTVRGQRADGAKHVRFHKVFQLPPTSNLDGISGRFDAGVLTLTVPKRPAPPPATIQEIMKPADEATKPPKEESKPTEMAKPKEEAETMAPPQVQAERPGKDEAKKTEQQHKEEINKPPKEKKAEQHKELDQTNKPKEEVEAKRSKPEQKITAPPVVRKEEDKPTKPEAAAAPAETKPPQAKVVDRESLLERVRRRAEEERAKAAAAAEEAERQRKQSACGGWKERVAEDLHGLATSEWAEGVVDTVKKNKEVIAAAVAAFSLGVFVSSRLFSRN